MEEAALGVAIASIIYNIVLRYQLYKVSKHRLIVHLTNLSEGTIDDIIKDGLPQTHEPG